MPGVAAGSAAGATDEHAVTSVQIRRNTAAHPFPITLHGAPLSVLEGTRTMG
jgi:hypothetical protein